MKALPGCRTLKIFTRGGDYRLPEIKMERQKKFVGEGGGQGMKKS